MEKFKARRGAGGAVPGSSRFNASPAASAASRRSRGSRGGGRVIRGGVGRRGFSGSTASGYAAWRGGGNTSFQPHQLQQQQPQQQQPQQQQYQRQPRFQQIQQRHHHQQQQRNQSLIKRVWQNRRGRRGVSGAAVSSSSSAANQQQQQQLQNSDPLNLRWVAAESQRRELAGLSPMPGDSALGSPVLPSADEEGGDNKGDNDGEPDVKCEPTDSTLATNASAPATVPSSSNIGVEATGASATSAPAVAVTPAPGALHRFKRPAGGNYGGRGSFFQPIYGNYRAYYGKRLRAGNLNIGRLQDDRLELLQPDWYLGRDVLDIGCNDGILSLKIAETLGVKSLTGIDIDGHLVQRAQRNLRLRVREAESELRLKQSLAREGYQVQPQQQSRTGFPYNVFFQTGNYVLDSEEQLAKLEDSKYDVIQAFSITKWIHLNWGDRGLKLFFRRAFHELRPDGKLIVEPQPFESYKKKLLCPEHKRNYASIQMRPEKFREYLERDVGFAHSLYISEQRQYHGFQRPVLMCTKPTGRTPALNPVPPPLPLPSGTLPPAAAASAAETQRTAVAMAAVSSAAETPDSIRLTAAASPIDGLDSYEGFDSGGSQES